MSSPPAEAPAEEPMFKSFGAVHTVESDLQEISVPAASEVTKTETVNPDGTITTVTETVNPDGTVTREEKTSMPDDGGFVPPPLEEGSMDFMSEEFPAGDQQQSLE